MMYLIDEYMLSAFLYPSTSKQNLKGFSYWEQASDETCFHKSTSSVHFSGPLLTRMQLRRNVEALSPLESCHRLGEVNIETVCPFWTHIKHKEWLRSNPMTLICSHPISMGYFSSIEFFVMSNRTSLKDFWGMGFRLLSFLHHLITLNEWSSRGEPPSNLTIENSD